MYRSPEMLVMSMQQEINTAKVHLLLEKKKKKKTSFGEPAPLRKARFTL